MTDPAPQTAQPVTHRGRGKRAGKPSPPLLGLVRGAARGMSAVSPALAAICLEQAFLTPRRYKIRERERPWMEGAAVSRIRFDGRRWMPVYGWGAGPVVLLVHGFAGRASQMGGFVAPLVAQGYRVVSFDAPAHGAADGRKSSIPEAVQAVERMAAHLGPLAAVVAHSAGAAACIVALSRGLACGRAVLVAPNEDLVGFQRRLARHLGMTERVAALTRARIEARYGMGFAALRGAPLAAGLRLPGLIVHDREDARVPFDDGERIARAWPGAELVATRGLGHARILSDAEVVARAVRFIGPAGAEV